MTYRPTTSRGYTLIELIVSIGVFAIVMTLATGAYLITIAVNQEAQATSTGIDNLSFALDDMSRTIRTDTNYSCNGGGDCSYQNGGGSSMSVKDSSGVTHTYALANGAITKDGAALTDATVDITSLKFYVTGTKSAGPSDDYLQPQVLMIISGSVLSRPGNPPSSFTIETSATMRGIDL
jgi:prepilin-type N-terminal cleavage/methylation domain-containing protein